MAGIATATTQGPELRSRPPRTTLADATRAARPLPRGGSPAFTVRQSVAMAANRAVRAPAGPPAPLRSRPSGQQDAATCARAGRCGLALGPPLRRGRRCCRRRAHLVRHHYAPVSAPGATPDVHAVSVVTSRRLRRYCGGRGGTLCGRAAIFAHSVCVITTRRLPRRPFGRPWGLPGESKTFFLAIGKW